MGENLDTLIEKMILDNYQSLHKDITASTNSDAVLHSILTAIAMGDGRRHSTYKRSRVPQNEADEAINELIKRAIILSEPLKNLSNDRGDFDRLKLAVAFVRFWFAFVSPLFQGIRDRNYDEFRERFANHKQEFVTSIYEELFRDLIILSSDDAIVEMASYYDGDVDFELYATTKSNKTIIGTLKLSKDKMKKSDLTRLQEKASSINIKPDIYVLFSKNGFSNELKAMKGADLKLFSAKNLKSIIE